MEFMQERFKVVEESQSAHCCFSHTVVDTSKPITYNGVHFNDQYEPVCECFCKMDADMVVKALNNLVNV